MATDFFGRFLLSRNYKIQIVAHVGRKSVVVLSGRLEASYRHFFIGQVSGCSRGRFHCLSDEIPYFHLLSLLSPQENPTIGGHPGRNPYDRGENGGIVAPPPRASRECIPPPTVIQGEGIQGNAWSVSRANALPEPLPTVLRAYY